MKQLFAFFLLAISLQVQAQVPDTSLSQYAGKYIFPAGSPAQFAEVSLVNAELVISAAIGSTTLERLWVDSFKMVEYSGGVKFLRSASQQVTGIYVALAEMGLTLTGEKEAVAAKPADTSFALQPLSKPRYIAAGKFDIQAHQGGCGLYPCNTVPAFINAVKLGVATLELDCVISKDRKVVVSHDQFMNFAIRTPEGKDIITRDNQRGFNIYTMSYDSVRRYDAGSRPNPEFAQQKKMAAYKPLLSEVFDSVENYVAAKKLSPVKYNIEIKSLAGDNVFHPEPEVFTDLVVKEIENKHLSDRVLIQSFDVRALQYLHRKYPELALSYLVGNAASVEDNIKRLGFVPDVYSPEFKLVTAETVQRIAALNSCLIPWTVDGDGDIQRIMGLGVDGIISNYPNRVLSAVQRSKTGKVK
ncbi:glycerophosphodiester phosphodiesterase family protein [Filimonas effusa]|uniref:GP-PDE domain-containing protein n=1 Tax=Filimonas effusa TaxID=2508721 RepID=A0A4Q1D3Z6_9BACT|nr:glycerophosphodiester phosphodiesterase family protein [Filimonas effusa]RXK83058.1 hypothetical protein ESB13_13105 [Filimonas effusa]